MKKKFKLGFLYGTVVSCSDPYFRVKYDDGGVEEYIKNELLRILSKTQKCSSLLFHTSISAPKHIHCIPSSTFQSKKRGCEPTQRNYVNELKEKFDVTRNKILSLLKRCVSIDLTTDTLCDM